MAVNGVLLLNKPVGPTSFDLVAFIKREFHQKKVGHAGTLDPMASGLLIVCLGTATKLIPYLMHTMKEYQAVARLGIITDTDDAAPEHKIINQVADETVAKLSSQEITQTLEGFIGKIIQHPPRFSALKINGKRLYKLAREQDENLESIVAEKAREIYIENIQVQKINLPDVHFSVRCGAGTYIRSIARDLGEKLHVGGHLTALYRNKIGIFDVMNAAQLHYHEKKLHFQTDPVLLSPLQALSHLDALLIDDSLVLQIKIGIDKGLSQLIFPKDLTKNVLLIDKDNRPIAIVAYEDHSWKIKLRSF